MNKLLNAINTADNFWSRLKPVLLWLFLNFVWILLLLGSYYYGRDSWTLVRSGAVVEGTVTALKESPATQDAGITYTPVISYTIKEQTYFFTANISSDPPAYKIGEHVKLVYNPETPSQARINSWRELWLTPMLLGGAAIIIALVVNAMAISSISGDR